MAVPEVMESRLGTVPWGTQTSLPPNLSSENMLESASDTGTILDAGAVDGIIGSGAAGAPGGASAGAAGAG